MANEQNLQPLGQDEKSKKKARELGAKGGKASGEAKRRKKDLKACMEALLETMVTDNKTGMQVSGAEAISMKQFEKALKGDIQDFRDRVDQVVHLLRSLIGEGDLFLMQFLGMLGDVHRVVRDTFQVGDLTK